MENGGKPLRHVAIIMDGNGRWAKERGLPRAAGHQAGIESIREAVNACVDLNIPVLTLYAFSRENWKRPKEEVSVLMDLLVFFLDQEVESLVNGGVCLRTIGQIEALPSHALGKLKEAVQKTQNNRKLILNVALNYGARQEIIDAVRKILKEAEESPRRFTDEEPLTEEVFARYLYTKDLPDPDLLIRTSGEIRLSNFLLWQLSYSEIYITHKYWPDFRKEDFLQAVQEYQKRERRFGDVRV